MNVIFSFQWTDSSHFLTVLNTKYFIFLCYCKWYFLIWISYCLLLHDFLKILLSSPETLLNSLISSSRVFIIPPEILHAWVFCPHTEDSFTSFFLIQLPFNKDIFCSQHFWYQMYGFCLIFCFFLFPPRWKQIL